MIKDLLLSLTGADGDDNALEAAVALAAGLDAHLCALVLLNLPVPLPGWGVIPDPATSRVHDDLREKARLHADRVRQRLARTGLSFEVRIAESLFHEPPRIAAMHARFSDLVVMALDGGNEVRLADIRRHFASLLMESGRPVLVVPPTCTVAVPIQHAMVAWRPTREASRALHDALPLLQLAGSVDIVEVTPSGGDSGDGELPGADIAAHLARHGLKVRVVVLPRQDETVAVVLLRHAEQSGAQLLVAGGYGHSRLRQWALGGVTRDLLPSASLPVLFSH